MLIDLHAHSSNISKCCQIDAKEVVKIVKENKMDGIVLTNHYQKSYVIDNDNLEFAERYVKEFYYAKECGKTIDIKVFFGVEVTMSKHDNVHLLIYGVDEKFVLKYPDIFDYNQEELYNLVHQYNGILVQAHPFRGGKNVLLDLNYLDGIEINCHPLYDQTHYKRIIDIAKENNKIITCGGDFHADTHRPCCGVYLPDYLNNCQEIANYLINVDKIKVCIQEVNEFNSFDVVYNK